MEPLPSRALNINHDAILIFEIGTYLQETIKKYNEGVPRIQLNKVTSCILRHWELLRKFGEPQYGSINKWSILHGPSQYGEVLYRTLDDDSPEVKNDFRVEFIQDIIERSPPLAGEGPPYQKDTSAGPRMKN